MQHDLKTVQPFFDAVRSGDKTFELRRDDRNFQPGDVLRLREYDAAAGTYSGREVRRVVTYKLTADDVEGIVAMEDGLCILGLRAE